MEEATPAGAEQLSVDDVVSAMETQAEQPQEETPQQEAQRLRDERGRFAAKAEQEDGDAEPEDLSELSDEEIEAKLDAEENAPEDGEDDQTFVVKINGEEREVTKDELITHFQKGQSADEKFQEAAKARTEAERFRQEAESTWVAQSQANALAYQQVAQQFVDAAPTEQQIQEAFESIDPGEGARLMAQRNQLIEQANQVMGMSQQISQQLEQHRVQSHQQALEEAVKVLPEVIPEWADPEVMEKEQTAIATVLTDRFGFSPEELQNVTDPRVIALGRFAMKYDRILNAKQRNTTISKAPKTAKARAVNQSSNVAKLQKKLSSTKSIRTEDLVEYLNTATG